MERCMMISSDCHAGAPWATQRRYFEAQYLEEYDRWVDFLRDFQHKQGLGSNVKGQRAGGGGPDKVTPERREEFARRAEETQGLHGGWDPGLRTRELDREGVAGEIIFPDGVTQNHPPFGLGLIPVNYSPELQAAGARAYNRWLAELCATDPGRHAGIALMDTRDIDTAVKEITWAKEAGLFGGMFLPLLQLPTTGAENFWNHPRYEPIWAACEDLEMPLNAHLGTVGIDSGRTPSFDGYFNAYRPFWYLVFSGVFERHPKLQFIVTEAGGTQVLFLLAALDLWYSEREPNSMREAYGIAMKPSEYWYRQCAFGASAHSGRAEIDARDKIGVKNILWGSDYPHIEGTWPRSLERAQRLFAGLPEEEVRLIAGENAARIYKFDTKKMREIAGRIGPKMSDLTGVPAVGSPM